MNAKLWRRAAAVAAICGAFAGAHALAQSANRLTLEVLSSRPELVSGGDALVTIAGATGTPRTTDSKEVPLIVRQEKGVINRSAYLINILHDPAAGPLPTPAASSSASGWNGKLIYSFGPGVQANYHMGRGLGMMAGTDGKFFMEDLGVGYRDSFITRGYAIAAGSLNVMGTNSDDVKSAETAAKIKEHFIKQFGPPLFTIGHGASGGSMQQQLIANAHPGLIDGIMPAPPFADR